MKKQLKITIVEIEKSAKYKIVVNMGWDETTKSYPRKSRIVYGTKREAEAFSREWVYELENPEEVLSTEAAETVGEWLDSWIENDVKLLLSWEQNTTRRAEGIIKNNLKPHIGNIVLPELSVDDILNMYKKLSKDGGRYGKGLAPRTLQYIHTILNQALNQAVVRGKIKENPAKDLTPASSKNKDKDKWVVLDQNQLSKFLDDIKKDRDYPIVYTAAYTGARQSELLGLIWDKILWEEKAIIIDSALHKTYDEEEYEHRPRTKNRKSTRIVDISDRVIKVLEKHRENQKTKGISIEPNSYVFTELDGKPVDADNLSSRYRKIAKKNGYPGMTFHHLRHTHATILLSEGEYINAVAERLGHATPKTTYSVYGHVLPSNRRKLADRFDNLIEE